jgi:hypothetical protein
VKSLLLLLLIALISTAYSHPPISRQFVTKDSSFTIYGEIGDADITQIESVIKSIPDVNHHTCWIEAKSRNSVMVYTGEIRSPDNGGGSVISLHKKDHKWIVIDDPRKSGWVL